MAIGETYLGGRPTVAKALETVEENVEPELVRIHVVLTRVRLHVLPDVLGEVWIFLQELPTHEGGSDVLELFMSTFR